VKWSPFASHLGRVQQRNVRAYTNLVCALWPDTHLLAPRIDEGTLRCCLAQLPPTTTSCASEASSATHPHTQCRLHDARALHLRGASAPLHRRMPVRHSPIRNFVNMTCNTFAWGISSLAPPRAPALRIPPFSTCPSRTPILEAPISALSFSTHPCLSVVLRTSPHRFA